MKKLIVYNLSNKLTASGSLRMVSNTKVLKGLSGYFGYNLPKDYKQHPTEGLKAFPKKEDIAAHFPASLLGIRPDILAEIHGQIFEVFKGRFDAAINEIYSQVYNAVERLKKRYTDKDALIQAVLEDGKDADLSKDKENVHYAIEKIVDLCRAPLANTNRGNELITTIAPTSSKAEATQALKQAPKLVRMKEDVVKLFADHLMKKSVDALHEYCKQHCPLILKDFKSVALNYEDNSKNSPIMDLLLKGERLSEVTQKPEVLHYLTQAQRFFEDKEKAGHVFPTPAPSKADVTKIFADQLLKTNIDMLYDYCAEQYPMVLTHFKVVAQHYEDESKNSPIMEALLKGETFAAIMSKPEINTYLAKAHHFFLDKQEGYYQAPYISENLNVPAKKTRAQYLQEQLDTIQKIKNFFPVPKLSVPLAPLAPLATHPVVQEANNLSITPGGSDTPPIPPTPPAKIILPNCMKELEAAFQSSAAEKEHKITQAILNAALTHALSPAPADPTAPPKDALSWLKQTKPELVPALEKLITLFAGTCTRWNDTNTAFPELSLILGIVGGMTAGGFKISTPPAERTPAHGKVKQDQLITHIYLEGEPEPISVTRWAKNEGEFLRAARKLSFDEQGKLKNPNLKLVIDNDIANPITLNRTAILCENNKPPAVKYDFGKEAVNKRAVPKELQTAITEITKLIEPLIPKQQVIAVHSGLM